MSDIDPTLVNDYDDEQNENPFVPPSPGDLTSGARSAVLDPTTSTLTVNIEMSRSTEYAKEKKSVSAFLKLALPDTAVSTRADGTPGIDPDFLHGVDAIAQEALNTVEVAVARQHGLEVATDGQTVRVMNLFGSGTKGNVAAPAPTPGPFSPPAAAVAPAPQAPPVGGTAPASMPPQPAAAAPPVPGAPAPGAFPPPVPGAAPAVPQGGQGGFQPSANPNAWSNQAQETKAAIGAALETFATTGQPPAGTFYNNMTHEAKYKGFKVGEVNISAKVILNNRDGVFGPGIINYIRQCEAAGIQIG